MRLFSEINGFIERNISNLRIFVALLILSSVFFISQVIGFLQDKTHIYFLDVGQGDSELVVFRDGVKVLIDAGPASGKLTNKLGEVLSPTDKLIDILIISHPEIDHFGGAYDLLSNYNVGYVLTSDADSSSDEFLDFINLVNKKGIRRIFVCGGDIIKYKENSFEIVSPTCGKSENSNVNDYGIVTLLNVGFKKILFVGDVGKNVEDKLVTLPNVDVLKVSHHGSKFSSTDNFLNAVNPQVAVIEVGKNSYGHPSKEVISRLSSIGAQIFRTDIDGTIELSFDEEIINIFSFKNSMEF